MPILITVAAIIIAAIIAYYLARFMKGKLQIELTQNAAKSEELISGSVTLLAKKPIHGLLKVSLVGREKRTTRDRDGDKTTKWVEVYRYDHVLEETRDFDAGYQQTYPFDLLAPTSSEVRSGEHLLKAFAAQAGEGMLGSAIKAAAKASHYMAGRIQWHVESRLDAKGVDLIATQKCEIHLQG